MRKQEMLSHRCKKHPANRWFPVHRDYKSAGPVHDYNNFRAFPDTGNVIDSPGDMDRVTPGIPFDHFTPDQDPFPGFVPAKDANLRLKKRCFVFNVFPECRGDKRKIVRMKETRSVFNGKHSGICVVSQITEMPVLQSPDRRIGQIDIPCPDIPCFYRKRQTLFAFMECLYDLFIFGYIDNDSPQADALPTFRIHDC